MNQSPFDEWHQKDRKTVSFIAYMQSEKSLCVVVNEENPEYSCTWPYYRCNQGLSLSESEIFLLDPDEDRVFLKIILII